MRARYYDPNTQQFLTVDPMVGITGEAYAYASGDPTNGVDPYGLFGITDIGSGIGQIGNAIGHVIGQVGNGLGYLGNRWMQPWAGENPCVNVGGLGSLQNSNETVTLYRVAGSDELSDILRLGDYNAGGPGMAGKYFATSEQAAREEAELLRGLGDKGPMTLTKIQVPRWFVDQHGEPFKDLGRIPSVYFREEDLPQLYELSGPPEIIDAPDYPIIDLP